MLVAPARHLLYPKLFVKRSKVYIDLMRAHSPFRDCLALLALAATLGWPQPAKAQAFSADYDLSRSAAPASSVAGDRAPAFGFGDVHIGPAFQGDADFSGAGLSLAAGRNWFAQVSIGRSLQHVPGLSGPAPNDAVRLGGGYRWSDGQSLSLHVTSGRGSERLGLSVSYDWPRYFVRLSYDSGLNPVPQDRLRFSAGVRF